MNAREYSEHLIISYPDPFWTKLIGDQRTVLESYNYGARNFLMYSKIHSSVWQSVRRIDIFSPRNDLSIPFLQQWSRKIPNEVPEVNQLCRKKKEIEIGQEHTLRYEKQFNSFFWKV